MRGGLDDALDKLARRDELRRRTTGEPTGTPPSVTELIEAIAAVVSRHPELALTVGVEGLDDPLLLHVHFADGMVRVSADTSLPQAANGRHATFDLDADAGEPVHDAPVSPDVRTSQRAAASQRASRDDSDHYRPPNYGQPVPHPAPVEAAPHFGHAPAPPHPSRAEAAPHPARAEAVPHPARAEAVPHPARAEAASHPARAEAASHPARAEAAARPPVRMPQPDPTPTQLLPQQQQLQPVYPPHPLAATPPPPVPAQATQRIDPRKYHGPPAPTALDGQTPLPPGPTSPGALSQTSPGVPGQRPTVGRPLERGMPAPLARPIPLQVERPEDTELAARRLAAMLRDDPSLLNKKPEIPPDDR